MEEAVANHDRLPEIENGEFCVEIANGARQWARKDTRKQICNDVPWNSKKRNASCNPLNDPKRPKNRRQQLSSETLIWVFKLHFPTCIPPYGCGPQGVVTTAHILLKYKWLHCHCTLWVTCMWSLWTACNPHMYLGYMDVVIVDGY